MMDEDEKEEILLRLDERTKRVDGHLDRLDENVDDIGEQVKNHEERISNNEDSIETYAKAARGLGSVLLATITGAAAKLAGFIRL